MIIKAVAVALVAAAAAAENFLQSVASYAAVEVAVDLVSTPAAGVRFPGISNGILDMTLFSIILQAALLGVCYISAKVVLVSGDAPMVRVKCFIANIASSSSPSLPCHCIATAIFRQEGAWILLFSKMIICLLTGLDQ